TLVVPTGYGPAGDCVIVSVPPSGSDDPLSMDAGAVQVAPAETVTLWHIATGGWFTVSHDRHAPDTLSVYEHPTALFAPVLTSATTITNVEPPGIVAEKLIGAPTVLLAAASVR